MPDLAAAGGGGDHAGCDAAVGLRLREMGDAHRLVGVSAFWGMDMAKVFAGRYSATLEGQFVVFLIGMRVNRLWALHKWVPVAWAMPPMIRELRANRESGFLHAEFVVTWRGVTTIQYWRSFEHLHAYAHARDAKHLPAWAAFNRNVGLGLSFAVVLRPTVLDL